MPDRKVGPAGTARPNVADLVADKLRGGILTGQFAPGQRLIEADLTRDLSVSRGPLREALRRLAGEGIVDIVHNRGALVRRFSRKEVMDLFRIRAALEGLTARLAAENFGHGDNRKRFAAAMSKTLHFQPGRPHETYSEENRIFHQMLVDLSDNPQLGQLVQQLRLPLFRLQIRQGIDDAYWRKSYGEHNAIAKAILAGKPDLAEEAMRRHLLRAAERVMSFPPSAFAPEANGEATQR